MKYYLVRDWTNTREGRLGESIGDPINTMIKEDELWAIIQQARDEDKKISIHEIGDCLIDWS